MRRLIFTYIAAAELAAATILSSTPLAAQAGKQEAAPIIVNVKAGSGEIKVNAEEIDSKSADESEITASVTPGKAAKDIKVRVSGGSRAARDIPVVARAE